MSMKAYPHLPRINSDGGRPEILEAANVSVERYVRDYPITGHCIPPRVGKSAISRAVAIALGDLGAPFVLHLVPWVNLTSQICDAIKSQQFMDIYEVNTEPFRAQAISKIKHHKFYVRAKKVDMFSATLGLAHANKVVLCDAIEYAIRTTGKRPVIILDEVHLISQENEAKWNQTVEAFMDAGAYIVSMTGTKERADRTRIPGFDTRVLSTESDGELKLFKGRTTNVDGVEVGVVSVNEVTKLSFELKPIGGVDVGWGEAWRRGWMSRMGVIKLDFDVRMPNGELIKLSEMTASQVKKGLSDHLRDDIKCIPAAVTTCLDRLVSWRTKHGNTQALVITGADMAGKKGADIEGANFHARQIKREFATQIPLMCAKSRKILGPLNIKIATSSTNDGSPDTSAKKHILDFTSGEVDILIVKSMAIVGLDVPSCKINLMLSSLRNGPMALQAMTRQLTVWDECSRSADLIMPYDILTKEIIAKMNAQGGVSVIRSLEEIKTYEVDLKDPKEEKKQVVENVEVTGYTDETGLDADVGDRELVLFAIRSKWKLYSMTDPEILQSYAEGAFPLTEGEKVEVKNLLEMRAKKAINVNDDLEKYKGSFGKTANKLANAIHPYAVRPKLYQLTVKKIQSLAKKRCGVSAEIGVADIEDPDVLKNLNDALSAAADTIRSASNGH